MRYILSSQNPSLKLCLSSLSTYKYSSPDFTRSPPPRYSVKVRPCPITSWLQSVLWLAVDCSSRSWPALKLRDTPQVFNQPRHCLSLWLSVACYLYTSWRHYLNISLPGINSNPALEDSLRKSSNISIQTMVTPRDYAGFLFAVHCKQSRTVDKYFPKIFWHQRASIDQQSSQIHELVNLGELLLRVGCGVEIPRTCMLGSGLRLA